MENSVWHLKQYPNCGVHHIYRGRLRLGRGELCSQGLKLAAEKRAHVSSHRLSSVEALVEELERDPKVILFGEDVEISMFGDTRGLLARWEGRV
jgi:hypothetical protein